MTKCINNTFIFPATALLCITYCNFRLNIINPHFYVIYNMPCFQYTYIYMYIIAPSKLTHFIVRFTLFLNLIRIPHVSYFELHIHISMQTLIYNDNLLLFSINYFHF